MAKKLQQAQNKFNFHLKEINRNENLFKILSEKPDSKIFAFQRLKSDVEKSESVLDEVYLELMQSEGFNEEQEYPKYSEAKNMILTLEYSIEEFIENLSKSNKVVDSNLTKSNESNVNIKLPKFNLPTFDGDIQNWLSFKQIFISTIHENTDLTNSQKLQYLNASVVGSAHRLIKGFPIIDANYSEAWETLTNRFDNKRELAYSLCSKIFTIKPNKTMTSKTIHEIYDICNEAVRNLDTLGLKLDKLSEVILVHFLQKRIDDNMRRQWELSLENDDFPSFKKFLKFLENQARSFQSVKCAIVKEEKSKTFSFNSVIDKTQNSKFPNCSFCNSNHALYKCTKFNALSYEDKSSFVKNKKLCYNCLRENHEVSKCKINTHCKFCSKKHHSILHNDSKIKALNCASNSDDEIVKLENKEVLTKNSNSLSLSTISDYNILLSTAIIKIKDSDGNFQDCRVLLDSGSQNSLISEDCLRKLGLPTNNVNCTIKGIGNFISSKTNKSVNLEFMPHFNCEKFYLTALAIENLTSNLPQCKINQKSCSFLRDLQLADPEFYITRPIDVILGADIFYDLISGEKISGPKGSPNAIKSKLGWLVYGKIYAHSNDFFTFSHFVLADLEKAVRKFWDMDSIPTESEGLRKEEVECEEFYRNNHWRDKSGRYKVKLPFRKKVNLGESRNQAVKRLISQERRLEKDSEVKEQYINFMKEYEFLGHMQLIPEEEIPISECYYMPHHAVIREQSCTTKLRVVFDASSKSSSNISLNEILHKGPKLQLDLFYILLNFRTHSIALTADIEKMFRQILISEEDGDFQRIVWRENQSEKIQDFRLKTVTYGTTCAPYLAIKTIQQLAKDEADHFPKAAEAALRDFYVDDWLSGESSLEKAESLVQEMNQLMRSGGFVLRKWSSNVPEVLKSLPEHVKTDSNIISFGKENLISILGIQWDPKNDIFKVKINEASQVQSKRQLLSNIAKIYDPLGFLSPTTILAKILIQEVWSQNLNWDEKLTDDILKRWSKFASELQLLSTIKIPRKLTESELQPQEVEMHGFCDSSPKAYAAVIYMCSKFQNGETKTSLVAAKTRVAPLKEVTLPRLELNAAVLLSKLYASIQKNSIIQVNKTYFWTDSQIVLHWIKSDPKRWKIFVANRVADIQKVTNPNDWFYVCSEENPADSATRGMLPSKLIQNELWWKGPSFLQNLNYSINFPVINDDFQINDEISNSNVYYSNSDFQFEYLEKYSSFMKLIRITAWCMRFLKNCKTKVSDRNLGFLTSNELKESTLCLVKKVQAQEFKSEICNLSKGKTLPSNSKLLPLNPFIDECGILRVGGRLNFSNLSENQKHQIILPKKNIFTRLLIEYFHNKCLHGGVQVTLVAIRQLYWIISGKNEVRNIIRKCLTCLKSQNQTCKQLMGQLPEERITQARVFQRVGLDFAGPVRTKPNLKRSKVILKSYIALFICLATKAVHLELVSDLSTQAFLACLRRFIGRRGKPSDIFSDNATNFHGAKNFIDSQFNICASEPIQNFVSEECIKWHFIPPNTPHFGGLWEGNIKSMKNHLVKVSNSALLNFEELSTLLIQIEACLNSRPLTALSPDPSDIQPLTPGHFLIGAPLTSFPEPYSVQDTVISFSCRWTLLQNLRNQFWRQWSKIYLNELQVRNRWYKAHQNLRVGQLVLLKDDKKPPLNWSLARIIKVYPGVDQLVRVVDLKTSSGTFTRPITKLCPLPLDCHPTPGEDGRNANF